MPESEQELNQRIARWVWPDAKKIEVTDDLMYVDWSAKTGWVYEGLPFTASLDALAAHVFPKLLTEGHHMELTQLDDNYHAQVLGRDGYSEDYLIGIDQNPALACCLAVGKLLDAMEGK